MKHLPIFIVAAIFIASCDKPVEPEPDTNNISVVIGGYVYHTISGNKQLGSPGQFLEEPIKIVVTDLQGRIVRRNLSFTISDITGEITVPNYYYLSDTTVLEWKLGCEDLNQTIHVQDLNVCNIAQSGCIDVDVFNITAIASEALTSGWYQPCENFNLNYLQKLLVNDKRIVMSNEQQFISTVDPLTSTWDYIDIPSSANYGHFEMLANGDIFCGGYSSAYMVPNDVNSTIYSFKTPFYNNSYVDIELTSNGKYYMVDEYSGAVYLKDNTADWVLYLDISTATNQNGYYPQSLIADKNNIFIVTDSNSIIKIDATTNSNTVYEFQDGSWPQSSSIYYFYAEAIDNTLFLLDRNYYDLYIINLNDNTVRTISRDIIKSNKLVKSLGKIYLLNSNPQVKTWNGTDFDTKTYSFPFSEIYYGNMFSIYKGALIGVNRIDGFYYYIE